MNKNIHFVWIEFAAQLYIKLAKKQILKQERAISQRATHYALLRCGLDSMSLLPQTRRLLCLLFKDDKACTGYHINADTVIVDGRLRYVLSNHYTPVIIDISAERPVDSIFIDADTVHNYFKKRCAFLRIQNRHPLAEPLQAQMGYESVTVPNLTVVESLLYPLSEKDVITQLSHICDIKLLPDDVLTDNLVYDAEHALKILLQLSSYDFFALDRSYGSYEHAHPSGKGYARSTLNLKNAVPNIVQLPEPNPQLCNFTLNVNQSAYRQIYHDCQHKLSMELSSQSGMEMSPPAPDEPAKLKAEPEKDANKAYRNAQSKTKSKNEYSLYAELTGSPDREFVGTGVFKARQIEKPPPGRSDFPTMHNFTPRDSR